MIEAATIEGAEDEERWGWKKDDKSHVAFYTEVCAS